MTGDGAMGSQLIARGLPADTPGVLWNIQNPAAVRSAHREYVEAGAQYLLANTFGANPVALQRHGLEEQLEEIIGAAVDNARDVAGEDMALVGDLGPTGKLLEPIGDLSEEEAREAFRRQSTALAKAGVDAIMAETFDSSAELRLALEAAAASDVPLIASMQFNAQENGQYRSVMGDGPEELMTVAEETGCVAMGTNCGQGIATMVGLVGQIAGLTDRPVIAQPNAGKPRLEGDTTVYDEPAHVFAEHVPELYEAGARIIGGCCGTGGDHVRVIRSFADSLVE